MFKFFRDAQSELEHVVWPTPNETKKYMTYNIIVIIVVTTLLMVLGYLIQSGLVAIRGQFDHELPTIETTASDTVTRDELDEITQALEAKMAQSGSTSTSTSTGAAVDASGAVAQ
jgi:preprotein translocase SecE subunit